MRALDAVLSGDEPINDLHMEVDDRCFKLLALHQPMAADLRVIVAAVKINTDLERVGDLAVNIAEAGKRYLQHAPVKPLIDIPRMGDLAQKMLRDALDAFVRRDMALAEAVLAADDTLDGLKSQIFRELLTYMLQAPGHHRAGARSDPDLPAPRAHRRPRHQRRRGRHLHPVGQGRPAPPGRSARGPVTLSYGWRRSSPTDHSGRIRLNLRTGYLCEANDDLELIGSPYGRYAQHHRQPHRQDLRGPDCGGRHPRHRPQEDHHRRRRPGAGHLRPGLHEHRRLQEQDHLHRRRQGHPDVSRIPDRAARRAQHLSRDGVSDPVRRAAERATARRSGPTTSPCTPWCTRTSRSSWKGSPTTRTR